MSEAERQRESEAQGEAIGIEQTVEGVACCLAEVATGCVGALTALVVLVAVLLLTAACGDSEQKWSGPEFSIPPPPSPITVYEVPGPSHCGWGHVQFLAVPTNVVPGAERLDPRLRGGAWLVYVDTADLPATVGTFLTNATLPADAQRSAYTKGSTELWFAPSDGGDYAYLVNGEKVERCPRSDGGCD